MNYKRVTTVRSRQLMPLLKTVITASFILTANIGYAGSLCPLTECDINIQYANGGSIVAAVGGVITFDSGGTIALGEGGALQAGDGGSMVNVPVLAVSDVIVEPGAQLVLGTNGRIDFGPGGHVTFSGNIQYADNVDVEINEASAITIQGGDTGSVSLANINTVGTVSLSGQTIAMPGDINATGVVVNSSDATSTMAVTANQITAGNISAAGILNLVGTGDSSEIIFGGGGQGGGTTDPCATGTSGNNGTTISAGADTTPVVSGSCTITVVLGDPLQGTTPVILQPTPPGDGTATLDPIVTPGPVDGSLVINDPPSQSPPPSTSQENANQNNGTDQSGNSSPNPFVDSQAEPANDGGGGTLSYVFLVLVMLLLITRNACLGASTTATASLRAKYCGAVR